MRTKTWRGIASRVVFCLLAPALTSFAIAGSGKVLPPGARALGYSIDDMASAVANFSISGNDPQYYPNTPFQILYRHGSLQDPNGFNTFTVNSGTFIYAKFFFIDDSPPIIGQWPADKSAAADYVFGSAELGAHNFAIEVDGKAFSLDDPGYIGGPVLTPASPDGSEHMIQIGAFISPLDKGTHSVTVRGIVDGDAFVSFAGGPFTAEIHYTVIVQ